MACWALVSALLAAIAAQQQPRQQSVPSTPQPRRLPPSNHKVSAIFVRHIDAYFQNRDVASYNPFAPTECDGVIHLTNSGTPGRLLHRTGRAPSTRPGTWVTAKKSYHVDDYLHYFDKVSCDLRTHVPSLASRSNACRDMQCHAAHLSIHRRTKLGLKAGTPAH